MNTIKCSLVVWTWYQETPEIEQKDIYKTFDYIEDACKYLAENYENIIEYYPVTKIEIVYETF